MRFFAEFDGDKKVYEKAIIRDMPIINNAIANTTKELARENRFVWGMGTSIYVYSNNPHFGCYRYDDLLNYTSCVTLWFNKWLNFLSRKNDICDCVIRNVGFTFRADMMDESKDIPFERRAKFIIASQASESAFYKENKPLFRTDYPKYQSSTVNGNLYLDGKMCMCPIFDEQSLKNFMEPA